MDFAISLSNVVFPALGGDTIIPRWPFPMGQRISTSLAAVVPPGRSSLILSKGNTGVIFSNSMRFLAASGERSFTLEIKSSAPNFSPEAFFLVIPFIISPVFRLNLLICEGDT